MAALLHAERSDPVGTSVGESLGGADFDGVDDDDEFPEAHEINVTPFIDVMLVLLIVFMVAAPLSTVDLPVDLPSSTASPQKKPDKPLYVTIKPDLSVAIGETAVNGSILSVHSMQPVNPTTIAAFSCARTAGCLMAS